MGTQKVAETNISHNRKRTERQRQKTARDKEMREWVEIKSQILY